MCKDVLQVFITFSRMNIGQVYGITHTENMVNINTYVLISHNALLVLEGTFDGRKQEAEP